MQYSLFDELVLTLRFTAAERADLVRVMEAERSFPRAGLRESLASAFVRFGIRLDRSAGERALSAAARSAH